MEPQLPVPTQKDHLAPLFPSLRVEGNYLLPVNKKVAKLNAENSPSSRGLYGKELPLITQAGLGS